MLKFLFSLLVFTIVNNAWGSSFERYLNQHAQSGDLIFQSSLSSQSEALQEGSGSHITHVGVLFKEAGKWNVYEAVQPVKITPIKRFIKNGKEERVTIKRVKKNFVDLSDLRNQNLLKESLKKYLGLNYDIYFEWSDDKIYCSEFVYKGFINAFNKSPGTMQEIREFNLDGPYIKDLVLKRYGSINKELNLNEKIVSPLSMYNDKNLKFILDSKYLKESRQSL